MTGFVKNHASAAVNASSATFANAQNLTSNVPAGNTLIVAVVFDNQSTTTPTVSTIGRPVGETATWVKLGFFDSPTSTAAGGVRGELWGIRTTVEWSSTLNYSITLSGTVNAKSATWREFSGLSLTLRNTAGSQSSTSGSLAPATSGTTPQVGDIALGLLGHEANTIPGGSTVTSGGTWDTGFGINTTGGGSAANVGHRQQYKYLTSTVQQSYTPGSVTGDCGGLVLILVADQVAPDAPTNVTAARNGQDALEVSWVNETAGWPASNYYVERSKNGGSYYEVLDGFSSGSPAVDDLGGVGFYDIGNSTTNFGASTTQSQVATKFVWPGGTITSVDVALVKNGSPTDNVVVAIMTDSSDSPGADVATGSVAGTSLTTTTTKTSVEINSSVPAGTYWVVCRRSGAIDATNYYRVGTNTSQGNSTHVTKVLSTSTWSTISSRMGYYVHQPFVAGDTATYKVTAYNSLGSATSTVSSQATFYPYFQNNFEGGTNGVTITQANSGGASGEAFLAVNAGDTIVYDTAQKAHGTTSARLSIGATATTNYLSFGFNPAGAAVGQGSVRFNVMLDADLPSGTVLLLASAMSGATYRARLRLLDTGKLQLMDANNATSITFTNRIPLDQWCRIEIGWTLSATVGQMTVKLFTNVNSTTPLETQTTPATWNLGGTAGQVWIGAANASIANVPNIWIDDVAAHPWSANADIGPAISPPENAATSVTVAKAGNQRLKITWTDATLVYPAQTYTIQRGTDGSTFPTTVATGVAQGVQKYFDTGLTNGTTYYYRVVATNTYGSQTSSSTSNSPEAFIRTVNLDAGTDGSIVDMSTVNAGGPDAVDGVSSNQASQFLFATTNPIRGAASITATNFATSSNLQFNCPDIDTVYARTYIRRVSSAATARLLGSFIADFISVTSSGRLRMLGGTVDSVTSMPTGTVWRVEGKFTRGGYPVARLYQGHSTTLVEEVVGTTLISTLEFYSLIAATPVNSVTDDPGFSDVDWMGPTGTVPSITEFEGWGIAI